MSTERGHRPGLPTSQRGYSLFEMVIVIIILGILSTITMRSLRGANDAVRAEETRSEMDRLAWAIAGNPELTTGGRRADYGYVGDVGALPPNLTALAVNPGLAAWDGPYIRDEFGVDTSAAGNRYTIDAWGVPYGFAGTTITSSGHGTPLTRRIALSADELLRNHVSVTVFDRASTPPGPIYSDSLRIDLTVPDGAGGTTVRQTIPQANGYAEFDSIPIGSHLLRLVYLPTADTLQRRIDIDPGAHVHVNWPFPGEVW